MTKEDYIVEGGVLGITINGKDTSIGYFIKWNSGLKTFTVINKKLFKKRYTEENLKKTYNVTKIIYE